MTVCGDTPKKIRMGRKKHGLQAVMLSDATGGVIEKLGLANQGMHSGPPNVAKMPIPTTVLVDAGGTVCWIDQSENYQRRSNPDRVRSALDANLG